MRIVFIERTRRRSCPPDVRDFDASTHQPVIGV
jgi:hypothetical protein